MEIKMIHEDKSALVALLYPGEGMQEVQRAHVARGTLFALYDGEIKTVALVTREEAQTFAIRKLTNTGKDEEKCYASRMVMYLLTHYQGHGKRMIVDPRDGTWGNDLYESLGFTRSGWTDPSARMEEAGLDVLGHPL